MKQGSSVHKKLEEQVHQVVKIETVSKEDKFGLRIWNIIEGLRSLRETGLTRELEVFGVVEGEVVIGIIDEISNVCPDEAMEEAILEELRNPTSKGKAKGRKSDQLPPDQKTLEAFLTSSQHGSVLENHSAFLGTLQDEKPSTFYIKDIKTRQSRSLPAPGSSTRPTQMQLMLYHRLLFSLAANEVSADKIFGRYGLNGTKVFSDKFIAEIANLDIAVYGANPSDREDALTELLAHNTLSALWSLMISEFASVFPTRASLSPLLTGEYRTAASKTGSEEEILEQAGTVLGQRCFAFDEAVIERYVRSEMAWWKGERPTIGVEVEDAFKCRICEFAEACVWRATKVEEGIQKMRLKQAGRKRSEV
jgi:exonuclease V